MRYIAYILSFFGISSIGGAHFAMAHVGYVVPAETLAKNSGIDFAFLLSPFKTINYVIVMVASLLIIIGVYYLAHHIPTLLKETSRIKQRLVTYIDIVPLFLRLGLGILFMGAAFHNVFVSPVIPYFPTVGGLELIIGFCLLLGFLVTPALLMVIAFYLVGLTHDGYLIGNMEVITSAIALLLLSNSRPGLDDILGVPMLIKNTWQKYMPLILRIGLGGSFIFLAFYEKIFNPHYFSSVVDAFNLTAVIPVSAAMWTLSVGAIELLIGILILFGYKTRVTSMIGFVGVMVMFFLFQEEVYAHVTIFAVLSVLFVTGGGHWSLDEHFSHSKKVAPAARKPRKIAARKSASKKRAVKKVA